MINFHEDIVSRVGTLNAYSMDQFISETDYVARCENLLIDQALTVQEATNKHMAIIVDHLANGYGSCLEVGKEIISTTLTIFQKCLIEIPFLIVSTIHDGFCSVTGALVDALGTIDDPLAIGFGESNILRVTTRIAVGNERVWMLAGMLFCMRYARK